MNRDVFLNVFNLLLEKLVDDCSKNLLIFDLDTTLL